MIERIARRYEGRWLQGYARGKLRSDPVFAAAFALLKDAPLPVLDVGCGIGLFEFYLRERGFTAPLAGFDFDAAKIAHAQRIAAAHYPGVDFSVADTAHALPGEAGHVVLFDVLHYLDAAAQRDLLERAADHVAPGGLCLIRESPRDRSWRFRITEIEEALIRRARFTFPRSRKSSRRSSGWASPPRCVRSGAARHSTATSSSCARRPASLDT